ncbi:MAG: hypothetical protein JWN52_2795 [Actinomycetia bacterium]|nr:hypothetical protein [Actinomycetes bacterium]
MIFTLLRLDLELITPGGVTAPESLTDRDIGVDLPLARDGQGRLHVPATSLAGSLRSCAPDPAALFGEVRQNAGETTATASPVRFLGTRVSAAEPIATSRTVIDRERGAPRTHLLWRGELLPEGSRVTGYLRLDDPGLLDELLAVLAAWRPFIGGGRSVGRGQARLTQVRGRTIDLSTAPGLRDWLTGGGPALFADEVTEPVDLPVVEPSAEVLRWEWDVVDGLRVGTGGRDETSDEGEGRASAPALLVRRAGKPCIPGSTWKGVLRSRCEYILRSLGVPVCQPYECCRTCLVCETFGWTGGDEESVGQRSRLLFTDSIFTDARVVVRQHVALDRVTGGARDKQLYAEEIVESGRCTLEVTVGGPLAPAASALLRLAVADLHDGFLAVGGSTTRGLGGLRRTDSAAESERLAAVEEFAAHVSAHATAGKAAL